ncbi:MAG: hypothetical protein ACHQRL_09930, partial [Gemmatimonadales bacterium]
IYESVVMAPNYERDIPHSLGLARQFLVRKTPAHFFRVITPLTLLILAAGLIACWHLSGPRRWFVVALGALAVGDVITFAFHYPRLAVMFKSPLTDDVTRLRRAAHEWAVGNLLRAVLIIVAFLSVLLAFAMLVARERF